MQASKQKQSPHHVDTRAMSRSIIQLTRPPQPLYPIVYSKCMLGFPVRNGYPASSGKGCRRCRGWRRSPSERRSPWQPSCSLDGGRCRIGSVIRSNMCRPCCSILHARCSILASRHALCQARGAVWNRVCGGVQGIPWLLSGHGALVSEWLARSYPTTYLCPVEPILE